MWLTCTFKQVWQRCYRHIYDTAVLLHFQHAHTATHTLTDSKKLSHRDEQAASLNSQHMSAVDVCTVANPGDYFLCVLSETNIWNNLDNTEEYCQSFWKLAQFAPRICRPMFTGFHISWNVNIGSIWLKNTSREIHSIRSVTYSDKTLST